MKRKHKRLLFIGVSLFAMLGITAFVLVELRKSVSFFCSTSELLSRVNTDPRVPIRVGGMIVSGSIKHDGETVTFVITDKQSDLKVVYRGILPPLFGEGMGAIAKGNLIGKVFFADELLAKHDERYMPKKYSTPNPNP